MLRQTFVNGRLAARTTGSIRSKSNIIVIIPGGPGLSSQYLDSFAEGLAQKANKTVLVLDLPNHGGSSRYLPSSEPIRYQESQSMLRDFFKELAKIEIAVNLIGHSLGALIAVDLLNCFRLPVHRAVLIGMPVVLERSAAFSNFLKSVEATDTSFNSEEAFVAWWKKVLPAYFNHRPSPDTEEILCSETSWLANLLFADELPGALPLATPWKTILEPSRITFVEGEKEIILPDNNFSRVQSIFPGSNIIKIAGTGHFPMLEKPEAFLSVILESIDS